MNSQELKLNAQARKQVVNVASSVTMTLIFSAGSYILAWSLTDGTLNAIIESEESILSQINNGVWFIVKPIYQKPDESKAAYAKRFEALNIDETPANENDVITSENDELNLEN